MRFIDYTIGLMAESPRSNQANATLVKAAFWERGDGSIAIRVENGKNMAQMPGAAAVDRETFRSRPDDDIEEARWALELCGWTLAADAIDTD